MPYVVQFTFSALVIVARSAAMAPVVPLFVVAPERTNLDWFSSRTNDGDNTIRTKVEPEKAEAMLRAFQKNADKLGITPDQIELRESKEMGGALTLRIVAANEQEMASIKSRLSKMTMNGMKMSVHDKSYTARMVEDKPDLAQALRTTSSIGNAGRDQGGTSRSAPGRNPRDTQIHR